MSDTTIKLTGFIVTGDGASYNMHGQLESITLSAEQAQRAGERLIALEKQVADLETQLAEARRREGLLRAVVENHVTLFDQIINWRIGIMGEFGEVYSGSVSRKRIDDMYLEAVAAVDGGALREG